MNQTEKRRAHEVLDEATTTLSQLSRMVERLNRFTDFLDLEILNREENSEGGAGNG